MLNAQDEMATTPVVVLDSNVVLDWWLFAHPEGLALGQWVLSGRLAWRVTDAMRQELACVLARPGLERWDTQKAQVLAGLDAHASVVPAPSPDLGQGLWCSDRDDQKFIDLGLGHPGSLLVSRDKAVLRLARRARSRQLTILNPTQALQWLGATLGVALA